jgi:hypothetical protein
MPLPTEYRIITPTKGKNVDRSSVLIKILGNLADHNSHGSYDQTFRQFVLEGYPWFYVVLPTELEIRGNYLASELISFAATIKKNFKDFGRLYLLAGKPEQLIALEVLTKNYHETVNPQLADQPGQFDNIDNLAAKFLNLFNQK